MLDNSESYHAFDCAVRDELLRKASDLVPEINKAGVLSFYYSAVRWAQLHGTENAVVYVQRVYPVLGGHGPGDYTVFEAERKDWTREHEFKVHMCAWIWARLPVQARDLFRDEFGNLATFQLGQIYDILQLEYGGLTTATHAGVIKSFTDPFTAADTMAHLLSKHDTAAAIAATYNQAVVPADRIRYLRDAVACNPAYARDLEEFDNLGLAPVDTTLARFKTFLRLRAEVKRTQPTAQTTRFAARTAALRQHECDDDDGGGKYYSSHDAFRDEVRAAVRAEVEYALGATRAGTQTYVRPSPVPGSYCCSHGFCAHSSRDCDTRPWCKHDVSITRENHRRFTDAAIDKEQPRGYWDNRNGRGSGVAASETSGDFRKHAAAPHSAGDRGAGGRNGGGTRGVGGRGRAY
jgi:hypothetical protein